MGVVADKTRFVEIDFPLKKEKKQAVRKQKKNWNVGFINFELIYERYQ